MELKLHNSKISWLTFLQYKTKAYTETNFIQSTKDATGGMTQSLAVLTIDAYQEQGDIYELSCLMEDRILLSINEMKNPEIIL